MKFIERLVKLFQGAVRNSSPGKSTPDIDAIRQNSPPDERDVDAAEESAARDDTGRIGDDGKAPKNTKSRAKKAGGNT
jgi:hypothetical protein